MFKTFLGLVLFALASLPASSQVRMISHVTTADGGFSTDVVIENNGVTAQTVTLSPYTSDGVALDTVAFTVDARGVLRGSAHDMLGADVSHFAVTATDDVKVNTFYDFKAGNSSPAFVGESADQGSSWRILPGNWDKVFDGLAVVNTGSAPTDVWVLQKNDAGTILATRKIVTDLAPNAKTLYVLGSAGGSDFSNDPGTYFEVSGDQLLAVTALQGTLQNETLNILLATESRPLSRAHSKRDDRGVWFIEDGSMYDVFEMMGYNVAFDRIWQMDVFRRQARGNLAEIISPAQISTIVQIDTYNRKRAMSDQQLDDAFAALDSETQVMIRSYVDGVNRRIAQINDTSELLPLEYIALAETGVAPFTTRDLMAHILYFQTGFSMRTFGSEQIMNGAILLDLVSKFGDEQGAQMFNDLRYTSDPQSQTMIEVPASGKQVNAKADQPLPLIRPELKGAYQDALDYVNLTHQIEDTLREHGMLIKGGSYAWAVHGSKTESGNPILYAGPQVGFAAPSLFVEGSIRSDFVEVSGMAAPGVPSILVGRTPHHAWSMQVGYGQTWDYYIEDPADVQVVRQETIQVKGQDPVVIDIEESSHGIVISELAGQPLAFKYAQRNHAWELSKGLLDLARSESVDAFGEAVGYLGVTQHLCYVDRNGNIAYWHAGRTPVRPEGDYRVPQGLLANQPVLEWDEAVIEPLYHEVNPEKGYFGGWNNKPHPDFVDTSATTAMGPFHRGHMVRDFFESYDENNKWTYQDLKDLAVAIGASAKWGAGGNPWTELGDAMQAIVAANPTEERTAAMALFDAWDGHSVSGGMDGWLNGNDISDASVLLDAMIPALGNKTFLDELGEPGSIQDMLTRFQIILHDLYDDGLNNSYNWFSNLNDDTAPQTAEETVLAVLDETLASLGPQPWGTGARGGIDYPHALFGSITALNVTTPTPWLHRATYAQCVEYDSTGPIRIESTFALGQSGTITGSLFFPAFDETAFSMKEEFDSFILRSFPLFD